jgi:hypothetical protein
LQNSENLAEDLPKSCCGFDEILLWILPNPHVDFRDCPYKKVKSLRV